MKEQRIPKLWENLNATWGGETGNGLIEDPNVTKEVGKMYIGSDGKAYICLKPSNINNSENYMPCNVVDIMNNLTLGGYDYSFINGFHVFKYRDGRLKIFKNIPLYSGSISVGEKKVVQITFPIKFVSKSSSDLNKDISVSISHYANSPNILYTHWYNNPSYPNCDMIVTGTPTIRTETDAPFTLTVEGWWK